MSFLFFNWCTSFYNTPLINLILKNKKGVDIFYMKGIMKSNGYQNETNQTINETKTKLTSNLKTNKVNKMNNKAEKIKKYILKKESVSTKELSDYFGVSEQTIRKYLHKLENTGEIKRIHGGAKSQSTFLDRLNINVESKKQLSKASATLINDNDTIYIDSGTTYYFLIDYIPDDINVNIITTSLPTAKRIKDRSNHRVYLIGGYIDDITYGTYSAESFKQISSIIFDKSFFGTSGFSLDYEFTENNFDFLDFQNNIRQNSIKSIIAAGSDKENVIASKKSFRFSEIDVFITDENIADEMKKKLRSQLSLILI